ncbi:prenyltransferase/squalene oxidase repeat-containing protein [Nannocystaceae bacterium ST9]
MKPRPGSLDPLALAIDRTQGWCRTWWSRIHHATSPWLVAIPDIGPSCEVLLADALFHDLRADEREGMLAWIRSQQHEDGSWHDAEDRPDLSLTCLGWWAQVQYGAQVDEPALDKALRVVHELGGARRANLTVRLWLAMSGVVPWDWVPAVPAELYLLPEYAPLSPARLSPWARQMVTAFHLLAEGPARLNLVDAGDLLLYGRDGEPVPPRLTTPGLAGDLLQAFDKTLKLARTLPRGAFHRRSLARALRWIDATQQAHGGWFSMRPTLYSLLALRVAGACSDDPRVRRGLDYLRRSRGVVEVGETRTRVLAQGLSTRPLAKLARLGMVAGPAPGVPVEGVRERLLATEIARPGPWQLRADTATGGWPLEADADSHLDLRTTCSVSEALRSAGKAASTASSRASLRRAADVMLAMQEADGSFAWFERGEADVPLSHLPWRDADQLNLGKLGDDSRVTLGAMVLRELAALGWRREDDRVARGIAWLERVLTEQGADWSVATLTEVARAAAAQCAADHPLRRGAETLLRARQAEDGSFGDEVATARAVLALLECGKPCVQTTRAARQLVARVEQLAALESSASTDGVPTIANVAQPGFGLSPRLRDPSAGVRDIHAALLAFSKAGGQT